MNSCIGEDSYKFPVNESTLLVATTRSPLEFEQLYQCYRQNVEKCRSLLAHPAHVYLNQVRKALQ